MWGLYYRLLVLTGEKLDFGAKQHKRDVSGNNMANYLARHTVETSKNGNMATGHNINWHSVREIYKSRRK